MVIVLTSEKPTSNCYLIEQDGRVIIIDPNDFKRISLLLESENWIPDQIILTHEHFDHIEGLEDTRTTYKLPVLASSVCSKNIQDANMNLSIIYDMFCYFRTGKITNERTEPFACRAADITFDQEYDFSWQGHDFYLRLCPGHSKGSALICMDDSVIFSGDYLVEGEMTNFQLKGGDIEEYKKYSAAWIRSIPIGTTVYPGHGITYTLTGIERKDALL